LLRSCRQRPSGCRAAEQRDEVAPFPWTEMHPIPHGPERMTRISDCSGSVSGYGKASRREAQDARPAGSGGEQSARGSRAFGSAILARSSAPARPVGRGGDPGSRFSSAITAMAVSSSTERRRAMAVKLDAGSSNRFPAVIAVDANTRRDAIDLFFNTRIEGQAASLRITLTFPQWENLKFLVDGSKPAGS
jgi:hypothetical protein